MATNFETTRILPDVTGKRFGSVMFGYDQIATMRREHAILARAVAVMLGTQADALTVEAVERLTNQLEQRAASGQP